MAFWEKALAKKLLGGRKGVKISLVTTSSAKSCLVACALRTTIRGPSAKHCRSFYNSTIPLNYSGQSHIFTKWSGLCKDSRAPPSSLETGQIWRDLCLRASSRYPSRVSWFFEAQTVWKKSEPFASSIPKKFLPKIFPAFTTAENQRVFVTFS